MSKIQVGDRIKVYDREFQYMGTVTKIDDQNIVYFSKYNYCASYSAHIKQCRKLVKKNTPRNRVDELLYTCSDLLTQGREHVLLKYAVSVLLGCRSCEAEQKLKEYFEKKNENK